MSISAYVGLPGHGKSYGVVENVIIPALKQGRRVFTNIPFYEDLFIKDFGLAPVPFTTKEVQDNPDWFTQVFIAGSVLVFDEIWRLWPAGLKANNFLEKHKEFLAEHRHFVGDDGFSTEIYLVTQDLSQVANFPRSLVETTYRMVKRISVGFDKRFRVDIYEGAVTGAKPPASKRVRELHGGKFTEKIYKYYKSHTKSQTGLAGNETRIDQRNNALGRLSIKLGILLFIVAIPFLIYAFSSVTEKYGAPEVKPETAPQQNPSPDPIHQPAPVRVNPAYLSKAKSVLFSHTLTQSGDLMAFIKVTFTDSQAFLSLVDLDRLGYKADYINHCLIRLTGADFDEYVMCKKPEKQKGFFDSAVTGIKQDEPF